MKKIVIYSLVIIITLLLVKVIWVWSATRNIGSWDDEKADILNRCNYLNEKVITTPSELLSEMPTAIGPQFQGEWALYTCSMYAKALANISHLYPETSDKNLVSIDSLISFVLSPELRYYDKMRWEEDPLETLEGGNSHVSYLSHLAWMIGNYKKAGGDDKYDDLHKRLCDTMNRRINNSASMNLPTYPGEAIYVPDMLVAIVALHEYGRLHNKDYDRTVNSWLAKAETDWIDNETGLLVSFLDYEGKQLPIIPVKGSYTALNCYYLSLINPEFAEKQYDIIKEKFIRSGLLAGMKEYTDRSPIIEEDIDAGVILFGLSPSGTAFAIGPATIFGDDKSRHKLLRTAEIAGHTVGGDHRHYWLANFALVGEAITLAMRTTTN